jgi:hypothetical protein
MTKGERVAEQDGRCEAVFRWPDGKGNTTDIRCAKPRNHDGFHAPETKKGA